MENPESVDNNLEENSGGSGQDRVRLIQVAAARPQDQYDFLDLSARDSPQEPDVQAPTATATTTSPNTVESEEYTSSSEQSQLEESDEFDFSEDQATFGYPKPPEEPRPLSASIHSSRVSSSVIEPGKYTGTEEKSTQHLQVPHYKTQPDEFKERQLQKSGFGNQLEKEKRRSGTGRKRHRRKSGNVQTRKRISTGEQSQLQAQRNPPRPLAATVRPKRAILTTFIEPGTCIATGSTGSKESHQPTTIPPQIMVSDGFREVTLSESKEATPHQSRLDSREANLYSREANLYSREANLDSREANLDSREANLDSREANLDSREANHNSREANLDAREANLDAREANPIEANPLAASQESKETITSEFAFLVDCEETKIERDAYQNRRSSDCCSFRSCLACLGRLFSRNSTTRVVPRLKLEEEECD